MWRVLFSKRKLDLQSKHNLQKVLQEVSYTCGMLFDEIDLPDSLKSVKVKEHFCHDPTEKLYYSSGYETICFYCGSSCEYDPDNYPQCEQCRSQPQVKRVKRKKT